MAGVLHRKLLEKISCFTPAKDKKVIPMLFLKNIPKDIKSVQDIDILYPEDIVKMAYGED